MSIKKECITIFTAQLARQLLRLGYQIVDVKPDKLDPDKKRSIFVFKNEQGLEDYIRETVTE